MSSTASIQNPVQAAGSPSVALPYLSNEGLEAIHQVSSHNQYGEEQQINIVDEVPLTIKVDGEELVTLMTLGTHPEKLVLGYLRNQTLFEHPSQIKSVVVDWDRDGFKQEWEAEQAAERMQRIIGSRLRAAMQAEDWNAGLEILDEALAELPGNFGLERTRFDLLLFADKAKPAYELGYRKESEIGEQSAARRTQIEQLGRCLVEVWRGAEEVDYGCVEGVSAEEVRKAVGSASPINIGPPRLFHHKTKLLPAVLPAAQMTGWAAGARRSFAAIFCSPDKHWRRAKALKARAGFLPVPSVLM